MWDEEDMSSNYSAHYLPQLKLLISLSVDSSTDDWNGWVGNHNLVRRNEHYEIKDGLRRV